MPDTTQFPIIFGHLKGLLQPFESHFVVKENTDEAYYLETRYIEQFKKPLMFSAIYIKKQYVSYHLFPVYMRPDLLTTLSQPLQKRMQGKACFNFVKIDEALFSELDALTQTSFEQWQGKLLVS